MEESMMEFNDSAVVLLQERLGAEWSSLNAARILSVDKRSELQRRLTSFDSADVSIVVSGSLARDEFTPNSDIDWTLLIDAAADPKHPDLAQQVETVMRSAAKKKPGPEGTFGKMVFSHDLIHQIGGEDDTNRNTTRRILMLLDSRAIGRMEAYDSVVKNVLYRYLDEDRG